MENRRNKTFAYKFCAKEVGEENYIIADAIRFEGNGEFICVIYYNAWNDELIKIPIYKSTSKEDFKEKLSMISSFYTTRPDGILDFTKFEEE